MTNAQLVQWAIDEIRDLDGLCRSMIPVYMPLDSDDMDKLKSLKALVTIMERANAS